MTAFRCLVLLVLLSGTSALAQTIWTGPPLTFSKPSNADWTLHFFQDSLTDSVRITRQHNQGIYNIAQEGDYEHEVSPKGTEWSFGTTAQLDSLTFEPWEVAIGSQPPQMVGKDMVLHLIAEDIYIDIRFLSWQQASSGGAFSYERSTDHTVGISEANNSKTQPAYPNPAYDFLTLPGAAGKAITVVDISGKICWQGIIPATDQMPVSHLKPGLYLAYGPGISALRFAKQ